MSSPKKLVSIALCGAAFIALSGCGSGEEGESASTAGQATQSQPVAAATITPISAPGKISEAGSSEPEPRLSAGSDAPPRTIAPADVEFEVPGQPEAPVPVRDLDDVPALTLSDPSSAPRFAQDDPKQKQDDPKEDETGAGQDPVGERPGAVRPKNPRGEGPDLGRRAPRPVRPDPVPVGATIMVADPPSLELGQIPTNDSKSGIITITNNGDEMRTLKKCKTSCGCTTANCPPGKKIHPGDSVEVEIKLSGGSTPHKMNKTVTVMFQEQAPLQVQVKGESISFVNAEPKELCQENQPDGRIVLRAADDQQFTIKSMYPPLLDSFSETPGVTQEVNIDWERWCELGGNRKLLFNIDHPKTTRVYAQVCMDDVRECRKQRKPESDRKPRPRQAPAAPKMNLERLLKEGNTAEIIKLIDDGGIGVDALDPKTGQSPLAKAAEYGAIEVMEALLDASADLSLPDRTGKTPIMWAGHSNSAEAIKVLVDAGADVNARDTIGSTALSWAAFQGGGESIKALIDAGAEVDAVTQVTGWTPLIWAAGFGQPDSIQVLIDAGANVEAAGGLQGRTPLMHAVRTGRIESVKLLLKAGASLESKDSQDKTALLVAASDSGAPVEMLQMLIDSGADLAARDVQGASALDLARKRTDVRSAAVISLLEAKFGVTPAEAEEAGAGG